MVSIRGASIKDLKNIVYNVERSYTEGLRKPHKAFYTRLYKRFFYEKFLYGRSHDGFQTTFIEGLE